MRSLTQAFSYLRRTPYQTIAALIVMALTFLVATAIILTSLASSMLLKYFESRPQIIVFFKDDKPQEEVKNLIQKLENNVNISAIKYVSKEDALNIYNEQYKNDPLLLEMVTADILPSSLEVSAKDAKYLGEIADTLKEEKGIEDINYPKDIIENLVSWANAIRMVGIILLVILILESLLIILTITGMKISMRQKEIEIITLLGASSWYIRWPFLAEGAIYGVIAATVSWIISYLIVLYMSPFLASLLNSLPIQVPPNPLFMLFLLLTLNLCGVSLGILGSLLSVKRYLR